MKHTPGPWYAQEMPQPKGYAKYQICYGKQGECVADICYEEADARLIAAAPALLEACKKALFDSSLDRSETVLSAEVHEALNNAIVAAEDCAPIKANKKRIPSPPLGPRSWCFGRGPAESAEGHFDEACDNCECIDRCAEISKAENGA